MNTSDPLQLLQQLCEVSESDVADTVLGRNVRATDIHAILAEMVRLREIVDKLPSELRKHWSFDSNQQPTHSWHTREDFIEQFIKEAKP